MSPSSSTEYFPSDSTSTPSFTAPAPAAPVSSSGSRPTMPARGRRRSFTGARNESSDAADGFISVRFGFQIRSLKSTCVPAVQYGC